MSCTLNVDVQILKTRPQPKQRVWKIEWHLDRDETTMFSGQLELEFKAVPWINNTLDLESKFCAKSAPYTGFYSKVVYFKRVRVRCDFSNATHILWEEILSSPYSGQTHDLPVTSSDALSHTMVSARPLI